MNILRVLALITVLSVPAAAAPANLTGNIVDEHDAPIAKASVSVYTALPKTGVNVLCPSCYRDCGKHVETGPDGRFFIGDVSDALRFRLLASADGYEPAFSDYFAGGQGTTLRLRRRAATDASRLVRGCIVDPEGRPIHGAVVARQAVRMARGIGYGEIPGTDPLSITDEGGEFFLRVPDADTKLDVRVRAPGFAPRITRELAPGEPPITISVNVGGTITGRVVHHGQPVAGLALTFTQPDRNSHFYLGDDEIGTDQDGRFVMTGLGTDTDYALYVRLGDAKPLTVTLTRIVTGDDGSAADVGELAAFAGRRVSGRVVAGGPLPESTRVSLMRGYIDGQVVDVDAGGAFAFEGVPNEPLRLAVHARGYQAQEVELPLSGDVAGIVLPLKR